MLQAIPSFKKTLSLDSDVADTKQKASLCLLSASTDVSIRFLSEGMPEASEYRHFHDTKARTD